MPFWTLDIKSNTPVYRRSIAVMSKYIGIPSNILYNYFGRNNAKEFENENVRFAKLDVVQSLRS